MFLVLEKLWKGGGTKVMEGGGRSTKKTLVQGKIQWKKNYARQVNLKNIHAPV